MTIPYRARVNERWFLNLPGLEEEFAEYDRREQELKELNGE